MASKVLITGAAGFIGSNLAASLLADGHTVIGYDNLSQSPRLNVETLLRHPQFRLVEADVRDSATLARAAEGCATLYHLAAFKIPRYGNAYDTLQINTEGTRSAIDVAIGAGAHLVFTSTSDVYGRNPNVPFTEDHDLVIGSPDVRRWAYAVSKAYSEQHIFAEKERRGLKFTIIRLFGGYGPNQNLTWWGGPQSVFIQHALEGQAIPIHGDGSQTRTFTYVADHVDGLHRCLGNANAQGEVINLGARGEITIKELAALIWRLIRPSEAAKFDLIPYSTFGKYSDVMRRVPDISKAQRLLGFEPRWTLEDGMKATIAWQKERRERLAAEERKAA